MSTRRGRPSSGCYALVASAALLLERRGHSRLQAITTAEEVCRARYAMAPWPKRLDTETLKRTMRRIAAGDRLEVKFADDMTLQLLAASHPKSEPLREKAAATLAAMKISLRESTKAARKALAESKKIKR